MIHVAQVLFGGFKRETVEGVVGGGVYLLINHDKHVHIV